MKKITALFLALILVCIAAAGCAATPGVPGGGSSGERSQFDATVIEVYEGSIIVEPDSDCWEARSSDRISVSSSISVRPGDRVRIVHKGYIMESYPAQLHLIEISCL